MLSIELRCAKIPFLGYLAYHYWFSITDNHNQERWEIWQTQNIVRSSWGHLHKNLMTVTQGVGNGDSWLENQWHEEEAILLSTIIRSTPTEYPYNYCYRYYPGPNSNTYIQWILDQANINYLLSWRAWGRYYHRKY